MDRDSSSERLCEPTFQVDEVEFVYDYDVDHTNEVSSDQSISKPAVHSSQLHPSGSHPSHNSGTVRHHVSSDSEQTDDAEI